MNPDWPEVTLHSYRVRWGEVEPDPRYAALEQRQKAVQTLSVPALVIHGCDDRGRTAQPRDRCTVCTDGGSGS